MEYIYLAVSTSPAFSIFPSSLISKTVYDILDSFADVSVLDFAFASIFLALAVMFLVSTSFASAMVASVGAVAAVCNVCGVGWGGFDWGCECEGAGEVRDGM